MKQSVTSSVPSLLAGLCLLAGCSESDRVTRVATDAADRQAQQNNEMADLNHEVAQGTRRLVEADAETRQDIISVHQDLQAERVTLSDGFDDLESERQQIAEQRRTESVLVLAAQALGIVLVAALVTGFCLILLSGASSRNDSDAELNELLIHDLVQERPLLFKESISKSAIENGSAAKDS